MTFDTTQLLAYAPLLILIGMGCVILLAETFVRGTARSGLAWLGVAGCVAALVAIAVEWADAAEPTTHFQGMLVVDRMALYLDAAFVIAALLTLLFAPPYLREQGFEFGEFYALVLFATAGMMMVAHAASLVSLLIGIETMSLAAYVLTGCSRRSLRSSEGAMKYFLMGAFATGFLVYGMALVYGATGGEFSTPRSRPVPPPPARRRSSTWASTSSSSRSRSRSRPCRSTCGRPTPTRARRRR